jgi:hypothetical protein
MKQKPQIREAYKAACKDIQNHLNELRKETPRAWHESWVVGMSVLDTPDVRKLNNELGLNTTDGMEQWYSN